MGAGHPAFNLSDNCCHSLTPCCSAVCKAGSDCLTYKVTTITTAILGAHLLETNDHLLDYSLLRVKIKAINFTTTNIRCSQETFAGDNKTPHICLAHYNLQNIFTYSIHY